jgi:hypothetical protein
MNKKPVTCNRDPLSSALYSHGINQTGELLGSAGREELTNG